MYIAAKTLSTFSALVFTAVNIHMMPQVMLSSKTFLTLSTWVQLISSMCLFVFLQMSFRCKPFVTHCTQIRSWLVIMWMLSDIITMSFNLHLKWTFTCTVCTTCKQNQDSQNNCELVKEIKYEELSQTKPFRGTALNQYLAVVLCYPSNLLYEYFASRLTSTCLIEIVINNQYYTIHV